MRLAALCVCGTLLAFSASPGVYTTPSEGTFQWGTEPGSCRVTLKPAGECVGEGMDSDACPYQMILPPLNIMLPWQLRELERTVKEVQRLKETVEQLRKACLECKMSHRESERMEGVKEKMKGGKEKTTLGLEDRYRETEEEEDKVRLGMDERERETEWERTERQSDRDRKIEMETGGKGVRERERRIEEEGETVNERFGEKEMNIKEEKREQEKKLETEWEREKERDREGTLEDPTKREGKEKREKEMEKNTISAKERGRKETIEKDRSENDRARLWLENVQTEKDSQVDKLRQNELERENTLKEERAREQREQNHLQRKEKETQGEKEWQKERDREKQTLSYGQIEENNQSQIEETGKNIEKEVEKTVQSVQRDSIGTEVTDGSRQDQDMASPSPSPVFSQYSIPGMDSTGPDQKLANPSPGSSTIISSGDAPSLNYSSNSMLGSSTTSSPKSSFISSTTTSSRQTTTSSIKWTARPRTRPKPKKHKPNQIEKQLSQDNMSTILNLWTTTTSFSPVSTKNDKSQDFSSTITRSWGNHRPSIKPKPWKNPRPGLKPKPRPKPGQKLIPGLRPQPGRRPLVKSTSPIPTNSFSINFETTRITDSVASTTFIPSPGVGFSSPSLQHAKTGTKSSVTAGQSTSPGYRSTTSSPGDRINSGSSSNSGNTITPGTSSRTIGPSSTIESQWTSRPGIQAKPDIRLKPRPRPGPKLKPAKNPRPPSLVNSSRSIPETTPRPHSTPDTITSLSPKTTSSSSSTASFNHGISFTAPSLGSISRTRDQIPSSSSWSSITVIPNQVNTTTGRFIMRTSSLSPKVASWWTARPGLKLKPGNRPIPGQGPKPGPKTKPKPFLKPRPPSPINSSISIPKNTPEPGINPDNLTSQMTTSLGSISGASIGSRSSLPPVTASPASSSNYIPEPTTRTGLTRDTIPTAQIISSRTWTGSYSTSGITLSPILGTTTTAGSISRTTSPSSRIGSWKTPRPGLNLKPGTRRIPGRRPKPGQNPKHFLKPKQPSKTGFSKSIPKSTLKAFLTNSSNPEISNNSTSLGSLKSFIPINSPETTTVPSRSLRTSSIKLAKTQIPPSPTRSSPRPGSIPEIINSLSPKTNHPRTNSSKHLISFTTPSSVSLSKTVQITNPSTPKGSTRPSKITLNPTPTIKPYTIHSSRTISARIIPGTNSAERHETSSTTLRLNIKPQPITKPKPNPPDSKSKPGPKFKPVLMPRPHSPPSSSSSGPKITPRTGSTLPTNTGQNHEARTSSSQMEREPKTKRRPFPVLQTKPKTKPVLKPRPAPMPQSKTTTQDPRTTSPIPSQERMTTIISQKLTTRSNQQTSTRPRPKSTTTSPIQLVNSYRIPTTANPDSPTPSPIPESSTPSVRELRVKTSQVSARLNDTKDTGEGPMVSQRGIPMVHPGLNLLSEKDQGHSKTDKTGEQPQNPAHILEEVVMAPKDCSDHMVRGERKNGVYQVTPDPKNQTFPVLCEMESQGGGWTIIQHRQDGSVNFNRTWAEYRIGFGDLGNGEFWLGNDHIHLLTRHRNMVLRVELEDFNSLTEYAEYKVFRVAGERQRYRLFVGGYSGTAGDALQFSRSYNHNHRFFTTPDRDYDRYPSGNCGSYYGSGWWFDACMAANLNGRYYVGKYKGVRNGIYWGTWHDISSEYYPTNYRQSFKVVRMMIRPREYAI